VEKNLFADLRWRRESSILLGWIVVRWLDLVNPRGFFVSLLSPLSPSSAWCCTSETQQEEEEGRRDSVVWSEGLAQKKATISLVWGDERGVTRAESHGRAPGLVHGWPQGVVAVEHLVRALHAAQRQLADGLLRHRLRR
jgi:hypothetical protein